MSIVSELRVPYTKLMNNIVNDEQKGGNIDMEEYVAI